MTILCLSGWQQSSDSLAAIVPDAQHFDYALYENVPAMFAALPKTPRLAIGWSLGGQLLARAISEGYIKPKMLMLLGAPYQCVADEGFPTGMPPSMLEEFITSYTQSPIPTLKQFNRLMALGDTNEKNIIKTLDTKVKFQENGLFWLRELQKTSCCELNFSVFPQTIIVHGSQDKVIDSSNAQIWTNRIKNVKMHLWPDCAHAPHLHDPETLKKMIENYV